MWDWYLGQAGFGEQIQIYGETFWRQVGSTVLWTFFVVWLVLVFVAIVVTLSRHLDRNEDARSASRTHVAPLRPHRRPKHRAA